MASAARHTGCATFVSWEIATDKTNFKIDIVFLQFHRRWRDIRISNFREIRISVILPPQITIFSGA